MTKCVQLCQESRWRDAAILIHRVCRDADGEGGAAVAAGLANARPKIEYSVRRQMAAAAIGRLRDYLNKEYLLDVG